MRVWFARALALQPRAKYFVLRARAKSSRDSADGRRDNFSAQIVLLLTFSPLPTLVASKFFYLKARETAAATRKYDRLRVSTHNDQTKTAQL